MYITAKYIAIKLNQDIADFTQTPNTNLLIICDGIGEFAESGIVSNFVAQSYIENIESEKPFFEWATECVNSINNKGIQGGTTLISVVNKNNSNKIKINYLGNGRIIQMNGDYYQNPISNIPYRFSDLMAPHVSPNGALSKHISHNSGKIELSSTEINLNLNDPKGDIILFMSDGISSLEECLVLKDSENRFWRNESTSLFIILEELNTFLITRINDDFQESLILFNSEILDNLKLKGLLEDDASLGIIITEEVLNYYRSKNA